ncbi:hypothetical protein [Bilophila wadsworthia]|uniref:hypothetical protein n=1 Tax=Bilophila wadsworthia TaxID=35833 RepID=UPI00242CAB80|nr:hypothetical protein [Bilophila wadsworthia]
MPDFWSAVSHAAATLRTGLSGMALGIMLLTLLFPEKASTGLAWYISCFIVIDDFEHKKMMIKKLFNYYRFFNCLREDVSF